MWIKNGDVINHEDPLTGRKWKTQELITFKSDKGEYPKWDVLNALVECYNSNKPQVIDFPTLSAVKSYETESYTRKTTEYKVCKSYLYLGEVDG